MNMEEEPKKEEQEKSKSSSGQAYYSSRPKIRGRGPSKLRQQFSRGMSYFLVIAASLIFYFVLLRLTNLSDGFLTVFGVLKPVVYGCVIAYLLNPIVRKIDKYLVPALERYIKKREKAEKISRGVGIFVSLVLMVVLIVTLCNLLLPELYSSIRNLIFTLPRQLTELVNELSDVKFNDSTTSKLVKTGIQEGTDMFLNWLKTDFLDKVNAFMSNLTVGMINFLSELFDALIGVIISIYLLFSKELCFIVLSILKMPYVVLVSVIVGVTNVIPFFGPYIGAIPSAILILLVDPVKGIYFVIFILLLQQFDGNILGPKILGNSTGLSAFWVIVAILLGGGLFGFVGMIMGVPTFAVIYYIAEMIINYRLERKKLPEESKYYDAMSYVDDEGNYCHSEEQRMAINEEKKEKGE